MTGSIDPFRGGIDVGSVPGVPGMGTAGEDCIAALTGRQIA